MKVEGSIQVMDVTELVAQAMSRAWDPFSFSGRTAKKGAIICTRLTILRNCSGMVGSGSFQRFRRRTCGRKKKVSKNMRIWYEFLAGSPHFKILLAKLLRLWARVWSPNVLRFLRRRDLEQYGEPTQWPLICRMYWGWDKFKMSNFKIQSSNKAQISNILTFRDLTLIWHLSFDICGINFPII
jgi:hypothetical protein